MKLLQTLACVLVQGILVAYARPEAPFQPYSTLNLNQPIAPAFNPGQQFISSSVNHEPAAQLNVQYLAQPPRVVNAQYEVQNPLASNVNSNYIQAPCTTLELPNGDVKIICKPRNPEDLTFRARHVLWIPTGGSNSQNYNIEVDNYKLEELIQAGFKGGIDTSSNFNILVKRPQYNAEAQVDKPSVSVSKPNINLQYEQVRDLYVHYPTDKAYSHLQGRIELPNERQQQAGSGISPRFSRNPQQQQQQQQQQSNNFQQNVRPQQFQAPQLRTAIQNGFQPQNQKRSIHH